MRILTALIIAAVLSGCPADRRIYVKNESDVTILSAYKHKNAKVVEIRPGRTKIVRFNLGESTCVSLEIDGALRSFHFSREMLADARGTGYGSRLDVVYEYNLLHFKHKNGNWVQVAERRHCDAN